MRSGSAPATTAVPVGTVLVDGVAREAVSVSTVRELGGGGVPGVKLSAAAEGTVEWGRTVNASSAPVLTPWTRTGNWPPAPGSAVQVDAGTTTQTLPMLSGVVDSSQANGTITSTIIDPVDRLHRRVSLDPMLSTMPGPGLGDEPRRVGVSSDWIVDRILRMCGLFTTPYMPATPRGVQVSGQGSMWPERGTCVTSGAYASPGFAPQFIGSEWGWGITNADSTYTPNGTITANAGYSIGVMLANRHSAPGTVYAYAGGASLDLRILADRSLYVRHNGSAFLSLPASSATRRVEVRFQGTTVTLSTDDGRSATATNPASAATRAAAVDSVRITAEYGACLGGVIVGNIGSGYYLTAPLSARIWGGTSLAPSMLATPAITNRDAMDVLTEIADATCRTFWWDESGLFTWIAGDQLLGRSPVATLTSEDNLTDLGWSESLADTFQRVVVESKTPAITRSRMPNVTVWTGNGDSMDGGSVAEEIAAPSNEEWVMVSSIVREASGTSLPQVNRGYWTVAGGVLVDGSSTSWASGDAGLLSTTLERIGGQAWKFTHTTTNAVPEGKTVSRTFPAEGSTIAVWSQWRGKDLPILRAYAKAEWIDDTTVTAGSGPSAAGDYGHDAGVWAQGISGETPGRLADFLAAWLCQPRARAQNVRVIHDPRVQVGDVIEIQDRHKFGVILTALITRVEQTVTAGEQEMALDLYIISGRPAWTTLGQHDETQMGTLSAHDVAQDSKSLAQHDQGASH